MADAHKNFAVSTVATAPSPASSGTSLVVASGHGTRFPAVPFNATIQPSSGDPDPTTAEVVRVTAISTDTLTIVRAQEGTSARTVVVGDKIAATVTAATLTDAEDAFRLLLGKGQKLARMVALDTGSISAVSTVLSTTGTASGSSADANQPFMVNYASGTSSGDLAGLTPASFGVCRFGAETQAAIALRLPDITSLRGFFGLSDQSPANHLASVNPAGSYIGWRYSSDTDTNWILVVKDGTTLTTSDSGIAVGTSLVRLAWKFNGTSVQGYINGLAVGSPITTNLPSLTGTCSPMFVISTLTAAARSLRVSSASHIETP